MPALDSEGNEFLRLRLAKLDVPLPLEPLVYRALRAASADRQHEQLLVAWESSIRMAALALHSFARRLGIRSPGIDEQARGLGRPSFGHWAGLLREVIRALPKDPVAVAPFQRTLEAFSSPLTPPLKALATHIATASDGKLEGGGTLLSLLQIMPGYRNLAQSTHHGVPSLVREDGARPLLEALVETWAVAPPLGSAELVVVRRLERNGTRYRAVVERMHGPAPVLATRDFDRSVWEGLAVERPHLVVAPAWALPLHPAAAVEDGLDGLKLGWFAGQVRSPTASFDGGPGGVFQVSLDPADYDSLVPRTGETGAHFAASTAIAVEPFRGLLPYTEADASVFAGREEEVAACVSRLGAGGPLVICGESGTGKSSLVRAGILPALSRVAADQGRTLLRIELRPALSPLESLRRSLESVAPEADDSWKGDVSRISETSPAGLLAELLDRLEASGSTPCVFIDQLEELVSQCASDVERRAILDLLVHAARSCSGRRRYVVLTVRADLLGELLWHDGFRRVVSATLFPLAGIGPDRLHRIVLEPLRGRNVDIDPALLPAILRELGSEPGSLALLSQVLATVWRQRDRFGGGMTLEGYEAAGRLSGALREQADAALTEASAGSEAASRAVLADVFTSLATADEGVFLRRRALVSDFASREKTTEADIRRVLRPFVDRRLVVLGADEDANGAQTVEVAHEALFTAWPWLEALLQGEREVIEVRQAIEAAAAAWEANGRRGELWTDASSRLRRAEELRSTGRLRVGERERDFLRSSRSAVRARALRVRAAATAFVVLGVIAILLYARSEAALRSADTSRRIALGAEAKALARTPSSERLALVDAIEALRGSHGAAPIPQLTTSLASAVVAVYSMPERGHTSQLRTARFSADGREVVTASWDHTARVWSASSGALLATLIGHSDAVRSARFLPDGRVVTASWDGTARLWDPHSGRCVGVLTVAGRASDARPSPNGFRILVTSASGATLFASTGARITSLLDGRNVVVAAWSSDGEAFATGDDRGSVLLWDADGRPLGAQPSNPPEHGIQSLSFGEGPSQGWLLAGTSRGEIRGWSWETGEKSLEIDHAHEGAIRGVVVIDGRVVSAGEDGAVRSWDARTGNPLGELGRHTEQVMSLELAPNGSGVLTASSDTTARLFTFRAGSSPEVMRDSETLYGASFSPDGLRAVTAGFDHTACIWDLRNPPQMQVRLDGRARDPSFVSTGVAADGLQRTIRTLRGHLGRVRSAVFSPDGASVATTADDGTIRLWDAATGAAQGVLRPDPARPLKSAVFSRDGQRLASTAADGTVQVWRRSDGKSLFQVNAGDGPAQGADFASDGRLAVAAPGGKALLWDGSGVFVGALRDPEMSDPEATRILSVSFSPDGRRLLTAASDGFVREFDAVSGDVLLRVHAHDDWVNQAVFSHDGTRIASASDDRTVRLWETTGKAAAVMSGHSDWVQSVRFAKDGSLVVSAGADGTVHLWRPVTGEDLGAVHFYAGRLMSADIAPDGRSIVAAGADGVARIVPIDADALLSIGCTLLRGEPEWTSVKTYCPEVAVSSR